MSGRPYIRMQARPGGPQVVRNLAPGGEVGIVFPRPDGGWWEWRLEVTGGDQPQIFFLFSGQRHG